MARAFIGILIEHHAGAFPLWAVSGTDGIDEDFQAAGGICPGNRSFNTRRGIRVHWICAMRRLPIKSANIACRTLPYQLIVGDKEVAGRLIAVRHPVVKNLGQMTLKI